MISDSFKGLFFFDTLAVTMTALVLWIGLVVILFAARYLKGDTQYHKVLAKLGLMMLAVITMVSADHILLMLGAWLVSNALLVSLMIHKPQWRAAYHAGLLTAKTFACGWLSLACAVAMLAWRGGDTSIQVILNHINPADPVVVVASVLMLLAVMTQSAIWPFHRWLLSSLNSPTPVSAIMHAGLVNGGGVLLARFAPLYLANPVILQTLFVIGIISACVGTIWKLMQHDIKRMLACSTMGQMGFMLAQCGLGLFPAAITHLCCHGMFKANLFLSANSAAKDRRASQETPWSMRTLICALLCGIAASYGFAQAIHSHWLVDDTRMIFIGMTFIAATQFAISLLSHASIRYFPLMMAATVTVASLYGAGLHLIERSFAPSHLMQPQPLTGMYVAGYLCLFVMWIAGLSKASLMRRLEPSPHYHALYMDWLNASQPHPATITTHRHDYRYV